VVQEFTECMDEPTEEGEHRDHQEDEEMTWRWDPRLSIRAWCPSLGRQVSGNDRAMCLRLANVGQGKNSIINLLISPKSDIRMANVDGATRPHLLKTL
jgi:hypothetical protein